MKRSIVRMVRRSSVEGEQSDNRSVDDTRISSAKESRLVQC